MRVVALHSAVSAHSYHEAVSIGAPALLGWHAQTSWATAPRQAYLQCALVWGVHVEWVTGASSPVLCKSAEASTGA